MSIDRTKDTWASRKAGFPKTTGSLSPTKGRCSSILTFTGTSPENPFRYCIKWPMRKKTRCEIHNGQKEAGLGHPNWINGRTAKNAVPVRIQENFERLLKGDQLTSLKREIAWQKAYYEDLMVRAEDGNVVAPQVFKAMKVLLDAWDAFRQAARPGVPPPSRHAASVNLSKAFDDLKESRSPAITEAAVRSELRQMWTVLANLTDKESRQYERLYNMITSERAMALRVAEHTVFIEAMERYVPDMATQVAIRQYVAAGFEQLARGRDRPGLAAGSATLDVRAEDSAPAD